jgi:hypothetical protein
MLDARGGFPEANNGRCLAIRNKPWTQILALTTPTLIIQTSRYH